MNFIKRGLIGIIRAKMKSFILLAVIFILGNVMSGAISIQQATGNVEVDIKERLGAAAMLEIDWEAYDQLSEAEMMEFNMESIGVDLIQQVGELSYVKYYDYSMSLHLGSESIDPYQGEGVHDDIIHFGPDMSYFTKGINYASVIDFEEQKASLIDGRTFTQEEVENGTSVAIISKKLAEINSLDVGETITLVNEVYEYDDVSGEEDLFASRDVVLEVIGIFESRVVNEDLGDQSDEGMMDWADIEYQNTIYVPNEIVAGETRYQFEQNMEMDDEFAQMMEEEDGSFEYYTPVFFLHTVDDLEAFEEEALPLLPELYTVVSATDQYDNISGPIESMSKLSKYVLIAAILATVLITGLVVLLFVRDRKHELGIYLSLGERRSRVVGQILIEVMIIAFIGIALSLFSGNFLAGQISETMMKTDDNDMYYDDYMYYGEFQTDLTTEDVLNSYEIKLDSSYILGFLGIGLLTILISTAIPLLYIVRLNPKKILM